MGTVFSFDIRGAGVPLTALEEAIRWLHRMDAMFSTYRADSEISRMDRGEIAPSDCSPEVREVLGLAAEAGERSSNYFSTSINGRLDPSGMVKGWAIEKVSIFLRNAGSTVHALNGGGDIQFVGLPAPARPWTIGVASPFQPRTLATTVSGPTTGADFAVATSSTAERRLHVVDPFTGRPATTLASITLTGERLTVVDAYATAALAMGEAARDWIEQLPGIEAFAVTADGRSWHTCQFPLHRPSQEPAPRANPASVGQCEENRRHESGLRDCAAGPRP
ncbi:FAD:protein FMN transferase [Paenarthrobacter sp. Z7-10]|uniref:FAD:protein FMN transferase n=1 Tax=Paenarthrobacter sp. Z7-10 TaxID=2787635 RepID=UPI0022A91824|nr:FAD:protein FMN transferase [Paenarthrobacter sp. Z7-10]MCZ2404217.1 FAD:protein FMN transferase [Paenarthrobacter sp. Z7-10]